jgi:GNAT superfamily N-acetyltransferase
VIEVREIPEDETARAALAMLELRPRWHTAAAVVDFIDNSLRSAGYRLVGVFDGDQPDASAAAGFREVHALAWGHYLYVDDVSTLAAARGRGCGERLMGWLAEEAARLGCEGLHLDSGVAADRAPAHRLYMRHKLRISAHHFEREI